MAWLGARVVIGGTGSGVGKTTVAAGLMAALRRRGLRVGAAKVGPDFIDPGYHALATGRPQSGRNLDAWICGADAIGPLAARAAAGTDVLVVEGVMGLFDGAADASGGSGDSRGRWAAAPYGPPSASTAEVAHLLSAPVVLVVDASAMSASVAALVHGFASFDPRLRVGGVVLNRVGGESHEVLLREALAPLGVPVLGALRRADAFAWRDRHLGLVPVIEQSAQVARSLDALADAMADACDLDALLALAATAPPRLVPEPPAATPQAGPTRVAVATGAAFSFTYPDNLERLEQAGAELAPFNPADDPALPEAVGGLYVGGGFPEVYAAGLATNRPLLADVRAKVAAGLVTWAECGGLLWLARSLDGHPMCGAVPADGHMTGRLTLGYRRATVRVDTPLAPAGTTLRGHEFHYSALDPAGDGLELTSRFHQRRDGFASPTLLASYLHFHLGVHPAPAERFVAAAAAAAAAAAGARWLPG